jgi:hypothetical protein
MYMKKMDLYKIILYDSRVQEDTFSVNSIHKGLPTMKLAIRVFALSVVVASAVATIVVSPRTAPAIPSHQSATASMPTPQCGPHICPATGTNNGAGN